MLKYMRFFFFHVSACRAFLSALMIDCYQETYATRGSPTFAYSTDLRVPLTNAMMMAFRTLGQLAPMIDLLAHLPGIIGHLQHLALWSLHLQAQSTHKQELKHSRGF